MDLRLYDTLTREKRTFVPLDPKKRGGKLPPNLEWLADVIPCNLWVIR